MPIIRPMSEKIWRQCKLFHFFWSCLYDKRFILVIDHQPLRELIVATLADSLYVLGHFSILAGIMNANPSHSAMLVVNSLYCGSLSL